MRNLALWTRDTTLQLIIHIKALAFKQTNDAYLRARVQYVHFVPLNARLVPLGASSLGVETKAWQTSTRASDYKKTCSNDLREVHVMLFARWVSRHQGGKPTIKSLPCSHFALSTNVEELTRLRPIHAQFLERCAQRPGIKNWRLTNFCPTELLRVMGGGVVASPLRFDLDENFLKISDAGLVPLHICIIEICLGLPRWPRCVGPAFQDPCMESAHLGPFFVCSWALAVFFR